MRGAVYTTEQAPGAIPNGTRVVKVRSDPGDTHEVGDEAVVLGSMGPAKGAGVEGEYGYFVQWDDLPGVPVFVRGNKIERKT